MQGAPVARVIGDGVAQVLQVQAKLVGAAVHWLAFHQRGDAVETELAKHLRCAGGRIQMSH